MNYYVISAVYDGQVLLILKNTKSPSNRQILFHVNQIDPDNFSTITDVKEGINVQKAPCVEV